MLTPPFLKKGDIIGITATARKISAEELEGAVKLIESKGYKVQFAPQLFAIENQFAGSDEQRKSDLQSLIDDTHIKAILIARGGYGTMRIIDDIDFSVNQLGLKLNRCYGSEVKNCNQHPIRFPFIGFKILNCSHMTFDNNDISGLEANLFSNCNNLKFTNNYISPMTLTTIRKSSFNENTIGVYDSESQNIIQGGNHNVFECNYFNSFVGDALINDNSPDNTFRCNEFEGYAAGMVFEGNSMNTDFEANSFNSSNIGLYLKGNDPEIGIQTDQGNLYYGLFNEIGALNENQDYENSLFINNSQIVFNPSHTPTDWFRQNSPNVADVCGNSCLNGPGNNIVSWVGEQYSKCLDSLFYGTKFSSLSTKGKWNLLFILYRKHYLQDTTLLNNRECLKSILRYFRNSNLHRAVFAYDVLVSPQPLSDNNLRIAITDLLDGYVNDEVVIEQVWVTTL